MAEDATKIGQGFNSAIAVPPFSVAAKSISVYNNQTLMQSAKTLYSSVARLLLPSVVLAILAPHHRHILHNLFMRTRTFHAILAGFVIA
jgi:hypothetical protein